MGRNLRWLKCFVCIIMVLVLLLTDAGMFIADATEDETIVEENEGETIVDGNEDETIVDEEEDEKEVKIKVTNALTGEEKYTGANLQKALDKADRGCIIYILQYIELKSDVVLRAEVILSGWQKIDFAGYKILMEGTGAFYVNERMNGNYFDAKNSYSIVDVMRQGEGYLYYLISNPPTFGDISFSAQPAMGVLGAKIVDKLDDKPVIYLDIVAEGVRTDRVGNMASIKTTDAEHVGVTFVDALVQDDRAYLVNGCSLVFEATNFDYDGAVQKPCTVIVLGDVNGNGKIDTADASLIISHFKGRKVLEGNARLAADANCDGKVDEADAALICTKFVVPAEYTSPLKQ